MNYNDMYMEGVNDNLDEILNGFSDQEITEYIYDNEGELNNRIYSAFHLLNRYIKYWLEEINSEILSSNYKNKNVYNCENLSIDIIDNDLILSLSIPDEDEFGKYQTDNTYILSKEDFYSYLACNFECILLYDTSSNEL